MRKNQPLVPRSNIAGSWTRGGGGGYMVEGGTDFFFGKTPIKPGGGMNFFGGIHLGGGVKCKRQSPNVTAAH